MQIATQGAFLDIAIKADFLAKVQSGQESHGAPIGTYLLLLPLLAFPASLFMSRLALLGKEIFIVVIKGVLRLRGLLAIG